MPEDINSRPRKKEHLPSKCFTWHNRLNSQRWVFVSEGLEDFKKVCPPHRGLTTTQGPREGFLPRIHHRTPKPTPKKRQYEWPTKAALFSKVALAPQSQKTLIENRESHQATHPLALYPHLEEALPAELLLKVLEVLDPERKLQETWAYCQDARERMEEPTKLFLKPSIQMDPGLSNKAPVLLPGQWLYKEKPHEMGLVHEDGPRVHKNVLKGIRDFCNWTTTLGIPDIHEESILQQFELKSKQSCDVLHRTRLNQVPLEPKKYKNLQDTGFFQKPDQKRKFQKPQKSPKAKWVKMRYGAWYLHTNLWKKLRADEPLLDPKVYCKAQDERLRRDLEQQEELLAQLHASIAFKDFILSRGYRMPRKGDPHSLYGQQKGLSTQASGRRISFEENCSSSRSTWQDGI
ncbi:protein FAM47E isoform X2 [Dipodomys merriami]|uniref:protein FAM47E isoform X2 n=1 Tax=Dipodomys merriami TaxID=94247 RepID=UPI0038556F47